MSMNRTILIKEVQYSNQAKILLGMTKMTQVTTTKMVTIDMVNNCAASTLSHRMRNYGYSSVARYQPLLAGIGTLTGGTLGEVSICPELDENIEESGFRSNNGGPTYARVNH